jgi:catechol 2,3-dioxygenase-like lactoylglutathione lyase family enzyme
MHYRYPVEPDSMLRRVYETAVYAADVAAATSFYADVVGLRQIDSPDEHSAAFRAPDGGVVLIFDPERTSGAGRFVPAHGARGEGHVAFGVDSLDDAAARLAESGVEIEREIDWPRGGRSLYFRDPAGNSVEFVEGEIWAP